MNAVCKGCRAEFPSRELGRWQRFYLTGEMWTETCPSCGSEWWVTLKAQRPPKHLRTEKR